MAFISSMTGSAVADLGFGGPGLGGQLTTDVKAETDEERRRRLAQMQQSRLMGPAGSLAVTSLFGQRAGGMTGAGY